MSPQITIDSGEEFTELGGGLMSVHINEWSVCVFKSVITKTGARRSNTSIREAYCVAENDYYAAGGHPVSVNLKHFGQKMNTCLY